MCSICFGFDFLTGVAEIDDVVRKEYWRWAWGGHVQYLNFLSLGWAGRWASAVDLVPTCYVRSLSDTKQAKLLWLSFCIFPRVFLALRMQCFTESQETVSLFAKYSWDAQSLGLHSLCGLRLHGTATLRVVYCWHGSFGVEGRFQRYKCTPLRPPTSGQGRVCTCVCKGKGRNHTCRYKVCSWMKQRRAATMNCIYYQTVFCIKKRLQK